MSKDTKSEPPVGLKAFIPELPASLIEAGRAAGAVLAKLNKNAEAERSFAADKTKAEEALRAAEKEIAGLRVALKLGEAPPRAFERIAELTGQAQKLAGEIAVCGDAVAVLVGRRADHNEEILAADRALVTEVGHFSKHLREIARNAACEMIAGRALNLSEYVKLLHAFDAISGNMIYLRGTIREHPMRGGGLMIEDPSKHQTVLLDDTRMRLGDASGFVSFDAAWRDDLALHALADLMAGILKQMRTLDAHAQSIKTARELESEAAQRERIAKEQRPNVAIHRQPGMDAQNAEVRAAADRLRAERAENLERLRAEGLTVGTQTGYPA